VNWRLKRNFAGLHMIKVLALDIDGVITDGTVAFDENGSERKSVFFRDIDAVFEAHRCGLRVVLVTGESTPWQQMLATKLEIENVYLGAKDKLAALQKVCDELGITLNEICFVGDSRRDASALSQVGLGLAPADASVEAKAAAHRVLKCNGGRGAVAEAFDILKLS
jgi:3-deoxy-D-manno-octulosonate 8-phosphate phosphatase (KDO 8-P phosphatase)